MVIESSDFFSIAPESQAAWSRDTSWFHLERIQVGSRLLVRKSLKPQYLGDTRLRETLRKEYEVGAFVGIDSEYIVKYYQLVDTPEECFFTMDFIEGENLEGLIKSDPSYLCSSRNAERLFLQVLSGLKTMHSHQVVHLDLKPTNIMITKVSHDVRIIDLGFCYADAYQSSMGMTDAFAAPEQQDGSGEVDTRTDIYAVGKILEWLAAELGKSCRWCRSRVYKRLVSRCLQKEKGKRWQNIDEMIAFLQQNHSHKQLRYIAAATVALICLLSLVSYAFSRPVLDEDLHVLYGNFSLLDGTCEAVGKTPGDGHDPQWQGNVYIYSEVRHWGRKYTVTGIADHAYQGDTSIYTVALPPSLQRIGASAFFECGNLESINIPEGVCEVGPKAFGLDTNLRKVLLPSTLRVIPETSFHKCAIESLTIPEGVESIDLDAFAECKKLRNLSLPQSLRRMGRGVFWRCESLETITLPARLSAIGEYAFMDCKKLRQVENHAADPQPVMSLFNAPDSSVVLLVPPASMQKYQASPVWQDLVIKPLPSE